MNYREKLEAASILGFKTLALPLCLTIHDTVKIIQTKGLP